MFINWISSIRPTQILIKIEILWQKNTMIMKVPSYFRTRKRLITRMMMIAIIKQLMTSWKGRVILKEGAQLLVIFKKFHWITKLMTEKATLVRILLQRSSLLKRWMFMKMFIIMSTIINNPQIWNLKILILDSNKTLKMTLFYLILIKITIKKNMRIWA